MTDGPARTDKGLDYAAIRRCEMDEDVVTGAAERRARGDERWIQGFVVSGLNCISGPPLPLRRREASPRTPRTV